MSKIRAEILLPTGDLSADIPFWTKTLGFRMDTIYPADNPQVAVFSGHGLRVRIEKGAPEPAGTIRILTDDPDGFADGQRSLTATGMLASLKDNQVKLKSNVHGKFAP